MGNRDLQRRDLKSIAIDWWLPIVLIAPDKVRYSLAKGTTENLLGDVRLESKDVDQETFAEIVVERATVTVRRDDLDRIPKEEEKWFIEYPDLDTAATVLAAFDGNNVINAGKSLGYIKLVLQEI